ncbi:uncharacterized protein LOC122261218 [Penaeus japonicus]|uniref:uncharacterized protein LOC122261218 n=1 Tax=Penaeus japonicus TaxID=27405 RepID=UPI001C7153BC|nr:uncharacterized protein LOC122261218 [Penaeus japonicus]
MDYTLLLCLILEYVIAASRGMAITTPSAPKKDDVGKSHLNAPSTTEGHKKHLENTTQHLLMDKLTQANTDFGKVIDSPWNVAQYPTGEDTMLQLSQPIPNVVQDSVTMGNVLQYPEAEGNVLQDPGAAWNPVEARMMPESYPEEIGEVIPLPLPSALTADLANTTQTSGKKKTEEIAGAVTQETPAQATENQKPLALELTPNMNLDRLQIKANKVIVHGYPCQCPPSVPCYCPVDL